MVFSYRRRSYEKEAGFFHLLSSHYRQVLRLDARQIPSTTVESAQIDRRGIWICQFLLLDPLFQ